MKTWNKNLWIYFFRWCVPCGTLGSSDWIGCGEHRGRRGVHGARHHQHHHDQLHLWHFCHSYSMLLLESLWKTCLLLSCRASIGWDGLERKSHDWVVGVAGNNQETVGSSSSSAGEQLAAQKQESTGERSDPCSYAENVRSCIPGRKQEREETKDEAPWRKMVAATLIEAKAAWKHL